MKQYNKYRFDQNQPDYNNPEAKYELAVKRVKRIKGFYIHALVYVLVNGFILISTFNKSFGDENFWQWQNLNTLLFWGIGLAAHGFSVFGTNLLFGKDWEEKKIQELMRKEKGEQWE
jgi:2TM domain